MRKNPKLPKSSLIEDHAMKAVEAILDFVHRNSGVAVPHQSKKRVGSAMGSFFNVVYGPVPYTSSSGVSGIVAFAVKSEDDSYIISGSFSKDTKVGASLVTVKIGKLMTLGSVFEPEGVRDIFSVVVHEIGHALDKNARFSPGSKAVIAKGGYSAYVNSRIEIQADAQAFARELLVMYGPEGKIDPRMIGKHVGWDGTYLIRKRYKDLDERSKRIFTLYVMNELERLGMLA